MKKVKPHILEQRLFSDGDSSDEDNHVSNQLIQMYNNQYSLMFSQTKNFFADCKDIISRFITLNNMGLGFNLSYILSTFIKVEDKIINSNNNDNTNKQTKQVHQNISHKHKYQINFNNILTKMGAVIQELLNFQVEIKSEYFHQAFGGVPNKMPTRFDTKTQKKKSSIFNSNLSNSHSLSRSGFSNDSILTQNKEQQDRIRDILKKGMVPSSNNIIEKVCNHKQKPGYNIQKLTSKIESINLQISSTRSKQQKIWNLFNQKRPSRQMLWQNSRQNEKDQQFKRFNSVLNDLVSQKNMTVYPISPYETVESSFRI